MKTFISFICFSVIWDFFKSLFPSTNTLYAASWHYSLLIFMNKKIKPIKQVFVCLCRSMIVFRQTNRDNGYQFKTFLRVIVPGSLNLKVSW